MLVFRSWWGSGGACSGDLWRFLRRGFRINRLVGCYDALSYVLVTLYRSDALLVLLWNRMSCCDKKRFQEFSGRLCLSSETPNMQISRNPKASKLPQFPNQESQTTLKPCTEVHTFDTCLLPYPHLSPTRMCVSTCTSRFERLTDT